MIGGNIDIRMFKADSLDPELSRQNSIKQYQRFISKRRYVLPFWAMGNWISGHILNSTETINHTIQQFIDHGIDIQNVQSESEYLENQV